jgi:hypothetical protein
VNQALEVEPNINNFNTLQIVDEGHSPVNTNRGTDNFIKTIHNTDVD